MECRWCGFDPYPSCPDFSENDVLAAVVAFLVGLLLLLLILCVSWCVWHLMLLYSDYFILHIVYRYQIFLYFLT